MSVDKSEIKKGTLNEVGARLDDMLEGAQRQRNANNGAKQALFQCAKQIGNLSKVAEKEAEETQLDLDILGLIKKYIGRAQMAADGLARQQENQELISAGKVEALTKAVQMVKKQWEVEDTKIQPPEPISQREIPTGSRQPGQHPGPSIAQQRRLELLQGGVVSGSIETLEGDTNAVVEDQSEDPPADVKSENVETESETAAEPEKKPKRKYKRRAKKKTNSVSRVSDDGSHAG